MEKTHSKSTVVFGSISKNEFLQEYWQRKPLLIRNAFPNFKPTITPDELAGLAMEELVESRLIIENDKGSPWQLKHGPFTEEELTSLPDKGWSLLVQGVDCFDDNTNDILNNFKFLSNWRLDDIMVSLAPDSGSVGPHFDHYDVFLLQGEGSRRWKIGDACDENTKLLKNTDLSILEDFNCIEEWILEPGDMLYLPPKVPHWGIAIDESITFSIGFRAPLTSEIIGNLVDEVLQTSTQDKQFKERTETSNNIPSEISATVIEDLEKLILDTLVDKKILASWFGKYMTSPRYPELFNNDPDDSITDNEIFTAIRDERNPKIVQNAGTRFSFFICDEIRSHLFANGQEWSVSTLFAKLICSASSIDSANMISLLSAIESKPLIENDRQALRDLFNYDYLSFSPTSPKT